MINFLIKIIFIYCFFLVSLSAETIKKLEISGNKRISDETIKIFSEINLEEDVSKQKLDRLIKNLYKTNFFSDINVILEDQILKINVKENPIIDNFQITGIKKQSLVEFIKGKIQLAEMKSFDQEILSADLSLIQNILKTSGYYFSKIKSSKNLNK